MTRLVAAGVFALLASVPTAAAAPAQTLTRTVTTTERQIPFTQTQQAPTPARQQNQTEAKVVATFLAVPKVKDWVGRYPRKSLVTQGTYDPQYADWDVKVWSGPAGEIATGRVDDTTGIVTEAWTGPQVAWRMARGGSGAFGGKKINSLGVWLAFCAVFLIGLADLRRPLSLRNLDLLALLSFSVSLWYFNHGRIFTSVPLVYPGLAYLLGRMIWIGIRDRPPPVSRPLWPVWLLAAAYRLPVRLQGRAERARLERDRRRLRGADRRPADRARAVAVRTLPGRGRPEAVRAGRPGRRDPRPDPDERTVRVGQPER